MLIVLYWMCHYRKFHDSQLVPFSQNLNVMFSSLLNVDL